MLIPMQSLPTVPVVGIQLRTRVFVFLAGLGTLALVALPYAMGPRPVALDRGLSFGVLAVVSVVGVVLWIWAVLPAPEGLLPTSAYGYWMAAIGSVMLCRAAFEISREPVRR